MWQVRAMASSMFSIRVATWIRRLISHGKLNSLWGLALVEETLWVGNFGDGRINNYNPTTGAFIETLMGRHYNSMAYGLRFPLGSGVYFTAGIADEAHGPFVPYY